MRIFREIIERISRDPFMKRAMENVIESVMESVMERAISDYIGKCFAK